MCKEGVLLCADTEHTGWSSKFHGSKLEHFEIPGGKIAFAFAAANSHLAWSAIQKCRDRLQAVAPKDPIVELEQVLDAEYRRHVLSHPSYSDVAYQLLVAVCTPPERAALYVTSETCLRRVDDFECIGIGQELASFIIRPTFLRFMPQQKALSLAAYALVAVKESIRGCGGMSIYLLLENDGRVGTLSHDGLGSEAKTSELVRDIFVDLLCRRNVGIAAGAITPLQLGESSTVLRARHLRV